MPHTLPLTTAQPNCGDSASGISPGEKLVMETPRELIESFAAVRLPSKADSRLQWLMDRNSAGQLQGVEFEELEALVELSENLSLLRAKALHALGRQPT
jgi:hypothetical protein